MSVAIRAEHLSKKYLIGHARQERYSTLRETMMNGVREFGSKFRNMFTDNSGSLRTPSTEEFWALNDLSFEIQHGESVGIIGRNGAGKSTLLKVLSRITEPTTGRVELNGRVASLLEVGTGFHPELTGRENIFLNGAILGMSRTDIMRKFDEIVDFSEVEKFLDTPVKRYSSGMYVRLAFAVAAHLEPEILVVDEVLAVGDAQFQKKCLGKMEGVTKEGRTVLFVSHNMSAIETLCETGIYLQDGKIKGMGNVYDQINLYSQSFKEKSESKLINTVKLGDGINLNRFEISPNPIESGQSVNFSIEIESEQSITSDSIVILIYSALGGRVAIVDLRRPNNDFKMNKETPIMLRGQINNLPLVEGEYNLGLFFSSSAVCNNYLDLVRLTVLPKKIDNGLIPYPANVRGVLNLEYRF
jgi:lipopolysaccharide transport system ATP-binding protein